ncbi:MAG: UbiH/UbiF family hydroxylase [Betaproteobacteria bacterium]|nr:UbiH/UbiF family hydroxylase [Betaproteobacteria bacterium]
MHFDVVIVGAGLAGASLAVALREARLRVAVLEGRPPEPAGPGWDSRIYAISPGNARFLEAIGAWRHLDASRMCPVDHMEIHGDRGARLDFSAYECGIPELAWIIESGLMARELWETLKRQANVTLLCPARPVELAVGAEHARLRLDDGRELTTRLVVGADGINSWVRGAAGIGERMHPYGEQGVVANFACERPHHGRALQWFREDGVLAWLPLPGNRFSMVWSTPDEHARELVALSGAELCERVAQAGRHRLGALERITPAAGFPLRLMRVQRVVAPRIALIGDAAHAIHPLSGHGINLGFKDAEVLAGVLRDLPQHLDCGEEVQLRRYARARAEEVLALQTVTDALQKLFRPRNEALSWLRNFGLNLTNRLPVVRQILVRYAIG